MDPAKLHPAVTVDSKNPLLGTVRLTSYRTATLGGTGGLAGSGTLDLELRVTRTSKESRQWALTNQAVKSLKNVIRFSVNRGNGIGG